MKIIAEYEPATGQLIDRNGSIWNPGINIPFEEYKEDKVEITTGLTVDDLIKLKTNGVI